MRYLLILTGVALLIAGLAWIAWDAVSGSSPRRHLDVVTTSAGFEGNAQLPAHEIEGALSQAKENIKSRVACSEWYGTLARYADWTAFILTGVITIIGGVLGLVPTPPGAPNVADVVARSAHLGRLVAILAACAAVLTATGSRSQATADALFEIAQDMQKTAVSVRRDVHDAKDEATARAALDQLTVLRGGCQTR